jgi:hypothetical protein
MLINSNYRMSFANLAPSWFFGYDVALEFVFAVISIVVALFAFKIFKKTDQKQVKLFGHAFLLIGISYLIQSILNYLIISKANETICRAIKLNSIAWFNAFGVYAHIFFMTVGLVLLVYMTFKTDNKKILWLLMITSLLAVFLSINTLYIFYLISTIYLIFISWHFINNYLKNKHTKTLLVAVAFLFLLFGSIHFIFAVNHQLFYVLGHILELFAYLLILANFYLVLKK